MMKPKLWKFKKSTNN